MSYALPDGDVDRFVRAVEANLRPPTITFDHALGLSVAEFFPDLTPTEQQTYAQLLRWSRSKLGLTPGEFVGIQPDLQVLRAFVQAASPTAAQNVAATKALIRVLRAVLD